MAKKSAIEKNNRRIKMAASQRNKRAELRAVARDKTLPAEERFAATM
ncbi:MAG TPA: 30S ribosomal protein S14, partial [Alphaproteobacteria bacterium]|nr:30S ribosomal protein S14 [Alphaproteobacteria bacterium]